MNKPKYSIYISINNLDNQDEEIKQYTSNIKQFIINELLEKNNLWTYDVGMQEYVHTVNKNISVRLYTNPVPTLVINDTRLPKLLKIESDDDSWSIIDELTLRVDEKYQNETLKQYSINLTT